METFVEFIALGYCCNDYLSYLPEIPRDGKVEMTARVVQGGGPAGGAAVGAARLGLKSAMMGAVGDDADGVKIMADFKAENVNVSHLLVRPGSGSPVADCWITPDGARAVAWTRNQIQWMTPAEVPENFIAHARVLHLDGHNPEAAVRAAEIAKAHGVPVSLDAGTRTATIGKLVELADILIASEDFARQFTGESDLGRAVLELAEIPRLVTGATAGAHGAVIADRGRLIWQPPLGGLKVIDTTGAGDAFHAGFVCEYLATRDALAAMRFATVFAGLKCTRPGARGGLPHRPEVEAALGKLNAAQCRPCE